MILKKEFLTLAILIMVSSAMNAQSLPVNGDFEKWGSTKVPSSWRDDFKDQDSLFSKSTDAFSGIYALKMIFVPQKPNDNRRITSKPMNLEVGKYSFSCYLKGEGQVRYVAFTKGKEKTGSKNTEFNRIGIPAIGNVVTNEWKKYTLTIEIQLAGEYHLNFGINAAGGSKAPALLMDNVSISKL